MPLSGCRVNAVETEFWILYVTGDSVVTWRAERLPGSPSRWGLPILQSWEFVLVTDVSHWEHVPCHWQANLEEAARVMLVCSGEGTQANRHTDTHTHTH